MKRTAHLHSVLLVVGLVSSAALFACGASGVSSSSGSVGSDDTDGGSANPDGGNASITAEEACTRYVEATRKRLEKCYPKAFSGSADVDGNGAVLDAYAKAKCLSLFSAEGSQTKPGDIASCADSYNALSCEAYYDIRVNIANGTACPLPRGTKATGAACSIDAQCAGHCVRDDFAIENAISKCGTCQAYLQDGAACSSTSSTELCEPGFWCGPSKTCTKQPATQDVGGPCGLTATTACRSSLYCNKTSNTCQARANTGGPCATSDECSPDDVCASPSNTCVPRPSAGEPCQSSSGIGYICAAAFYCTQDANRVCAARTQGDPGATCNASAGRTCKAGSCTADGHCPKLAKKGEACAGFTTFACESPLSCVNGTCVEAAPPVCN